MRKSVILLIALLSLLALPVLASDLPDHRIEWGNWQLMGDRAYQLDTETGLAKLHIAWPQQGEVEYEFNVRYESGAVMDGHGGFGIHVFVDEPASGAAWGDGNSYLLWLNYDANPGSDAIPAGLSFQIYKSVANDKMILQESISLKSLEKFLTTSVADVKVPVKLRINGNTGKAYIYDPMNMNLRYPFQIDIDGPLMGDWVALRTNGISVSFGL